MGCLARNGGLGKKAPHGAFLLCLLLSLTSVFAHADVIQLTRADGALLAVSRYQPDGAACAPVAILSPGAGGSERGLAYLATFLAHQGWLALVPGHKESSLDVLKQDVYAQGGLRSGLAAMTTDAHAYAARLMDVEATLAWARAQCQRPYRVLIGHSMGAATVMLEAGARNNLGLTGKDSFNAYIALSPQGVGHGSPFVDHAWSDIHTPVLMLTGTRDQALEGDWQTRTQAFADMPPGCKWLGIVDGATHMNFGGGAFSQRVENITTATVKAFLDTVRAGQCALPAAMTGLLLQSK